jgi:drug/metabolite transporter (DMT)-like permease
MGVFFALACAVFWAFAVILLKRSGESVSPFALNLFRVTCSLPLIVITVAVSGLPLFPAVPRRDVLILLASGIIGIAMADTLFHKSLNLVGAGITGIIDSFYSPMVVLFAFLMIGERLGPQDILGMALIMGAVLLSASLKLPGHHTRAQLAEGIGLGLLGIALLAFGIVIAKPILNHLPVFWVAAVRQAGSAVVLLGAGLLSPKRARYFSVFRPSRVWRFMVPATLLGSYLSLLFWIAGMKYTLAGVAAILTQSSTAFIILFSVIFLHEPMTRRRALSAVLALAGVLLVSLR